MNIVPTYHAMLRWNERIYHNYTNLNIEVVKYDIIEDFKKAKFISKKDRDMEEYKSKDNTFVVDTIENDKIIITVYPNKNEVILEDKTKRNINNIYTKNIRIKTRLNLSAKQLRLIGNIFEQEDYIILQTLGSKKYIIANDMILLIRIDKKFDKTFVNIIKKWSILELYDLEKFKYFQNETQNDFKNKAWDNLLDTLQINKRIFMLEQYESEVLDDEIVTYKKVLSGELDKFPLRFWTDDVGGEVKIAAKLCVKYLIEDILKWEVYDVYNNFNFNVLKKYKLAGMCTMLFNDDPFNALNNAYPNKFKPWLFKKVKFVSCWRQENGGVNVAKDAIQWMIEESKKDGFAINKNNLLSFNWVMLLEKYNIKQILTITFDMNYKDFFKKVFDVEVSDEEIIRYKQHFELRLNQRFAGMHF